MKRVVQTIALGAAAVALALGVWRDYGAFTALKRALIAYLSAYFLAGGLGLATRAALSALRDPEPDPAEEAAAGKSRSRRKQRPARTAPPHPEAAAEAAPTDPQEAVSAPQPLESA